MSKAIPVHLLSSASRPAGAVTALAVTPQIEAVYLTWTAPTALSTPITDYRVTVLDVNAGTTTTFAHTASAATNMTVTTAAGAGRPYTFTVTPISSAGFGAAASISATTLTGLVGAPTGLAGTSNLGSVTVQWTAPASQPRPVTGYRIEYYTGVWNVGATTAGNVLSVTVSLPTNGYWWKVTAFNASGDGGSVEGLYRYAMGQRTQLFTGSGTWVRTHADVSSVDVWVIAGGGNSNMDLTRNGGGGGGGVVRNSAYAVTGDVAVTFQAQSSEYSASGPNVTFGVITAPGGGGGGGLANNAGAQTSSGFSGQNTGYPAHGGGAGMANSGEYPVPTGGAGLYGGNRGGNPNFNGTISARSGGGGAGGLPQSTDTTNDPNDGVMFTLAVGGVGVSSPLGMVGRGGGNTNQNYRNYGSGAGNDSYLGSLGAVYVSWVG